MEGDQEEDCWSMGEDEGSWQLRKMHKAKRLREDKEREERWNVVVRFEDGGVKCMDPIKADENN